MVGVMLYPCILCVSLLMDLFVLCVAVFLNCLVKQFAICLGVVVILLLNVMEVFSVGGCALLDIPFFPSSYSCTSNPLPSRALFHSTTYFICSHDMTKELHLSVHNFTQKFSVCIRSRCNDFFK